MSTFLQIAQDARRECRITGTGPASVLNQIGVLAELMSWVKDAWIKIQNESDSWRWMRAGFSVNTVADTGSYAYTTCTDTLTSSAISRFARWYPDEFKIYLQSGGVSGEHIIPFMEWDQFKALYRMGTQTATYPAFVSIDPQDNIVLGPKPNDIYVLSGDYQRGAQVLAADADTPDMPARFHMLIVYRAMMEYSASKSAPEVYARGSIEGGRMMRQLQQSQLPRLMLGGALV